MIDIMQLSILRQRDVEKLFAASAYLFPLYAIQMCGWLSPDDLQDEQVKQYWTALTERLDPNMSDERAMSVTIQAAIEAGIHLNLNDWQRDLSMMPMPQAYANEISRRRYLSQIAVMNSRLAMAIGAQDDEQVRHVIGEMHGIGKRGKTIIPDAPEIAVKFEQAISGGARVIDTFIPPLDAALGGLERQTLTIVAARPSMGKTSMLLQIARNAAAGNYKVLFASLEMSPVALWARCACPLAGVSWRDVKAGKVGREGLDRLRTVSTTLAETYGDRLRILEAPQTTETLWMACAEYRPDLILCDHLRLFRDTHERETRRLGDITMRAREIGKSFNSAVVIAAQLNRDLESRGQNNRVPTLADLRDSGEIEENADVILMLYRDDYYNPPAVYNPVSPLQVWVRKYRDGVKDVMIKLNYNLNKQWMEPVEANAQRIIK